MKKSVTLIACLLALAAAHAQVKEGTVFYEQKTNLHRTITDEQMRAMIPEFRTSRYMLLFSDSISMYKLVPEDEAPDPFAGGGGGPRIVMRAGPAGGGDLFKNYTLAKSIQSSEVAGKNYLIVDSIRQQPWKIGTETKTILGYTCHKATRKIMMGGGVVTRMIMSGGAGNTDTTVQRNPQQGKEVDAVAWYADDLISPAGPENYGQLPGVILQLDIDNSRIVYNATEVKKSFDKKELKEPQKGKVVTQKEFMKIMSDMMGSPGGPGGMIRFNAN